MDPEISEKATGTDESFCLPEDPVFWENNKETRDYVAKHGFKRNENSDFAKSKREYNDGKIRSLTSNMFVNTLANGEKVPRQWLVYSESTGAVFCGVCLLFLNQSDSRTKLASVGFSDWKNAYTALKEHENSSSHRNCVHTSKTRGRAIGQISAQIEGQLETEVNYWKAVLLRVVEVVKILASRGLPLRGHVEQFGNPENGNFMMLLELIAKFDVFLANHIEKFGNPGKGNTSYLSSTTVEELIDILANAVKQEIIGQIKSSKYYSLIVDSTPDIAKIDQLSVVIRYILKSGKPYEAFLEFLPNTGHKAQDLFNAVNDFLQSQGLDLQNCRGQSYDNASNMAGKYNGLQARIKEVNCQVEWIPCSAHSLNLVGKNAAKSCSEACDFFLLVQGIYNFFSASTDRWEILQNQAERGSSSSTLKTLSKTRWSARDDAVRALKYRFHDVIDALQSIEEDSHQDPEARAECRGYILALSHLETGIMIELWGFLLECLNKSNTRLQKVETDLSSVIETYDTLLRLFESQRENFDVFEEKGKNLSSNDAYKMENRRIIKRKRHFDESRENEVEFSARENFRVKTFSCIIDQLIVDMTMRRDAYIAINEKFKAIIQLQNLSTMELESAAEQLRSSFPDDLEETLNSELVYLKSHLETLEQNLKPKSPINLSQWIRENDLQCIYPNVDIALRMYTCTPASNCTAERSFSCLKRIKNYLRSTMTEKRLNSLAILCIEEKTLQALDLNSIIDEFARQKARRKVLTK